MGAIGLAAGFLIFHRVLMIILDRVLRKAKSGSCNPKLAKAS